MADPKTATWEQKEYQFRSLVAHLSEAEAWPKMFDLLERKPFLADQADHFGAFERSGADVEQHAIPAAIGLRDWNRFLRYASLALNLRGVAEELAQPDILRALVRGGRLSLARDVVDRLADPLRRAAARSVLASACRSRSDLFPDLLRGVERDLENTVPTPAVLAAVARTLGPELSPRWPGWIARLPSEPAETAPVWAAVAGCWLDRGETRAPGLWEALARIGDGGPLLGLCARLGRLDQGDPEEALAKLSALFQEPADRWQAVALYLGRQTRRRPERAVTAWERWVNREPVAWTADLVESCREVLQRLSPARFETFCSQLEDPLARAALRIADLEARPDGRRTALALESVGRIANGPARLHWSLRFLEARTPEPADEARGQVGAVAAYLYELRYGAADGDLRRFLDLAARFYPKDVGRLIEDVAWSPACRPETLLALAHETRQETVAWHLLEQAERFAAAVSLNEAEGFKLRGELMRKLACRLCLLREDLQGLATAVGRILPEEEDDLRETLASELEAAGRQEEARAVAEEIRDPRRRFLTSLRVVPASQLPADFLSSQSLYGAMASARPLEEERLALAPLLQNPFDSQEMARQYVIPIRSGDLRAQGLLRLARHTLAFQRSFYGKRQDRVAALEVVRTSLSVETDEKLAALTPEIAVLGAEMGLKEAVAEFQEAGRQLASLGTVPWNARAEAMEDLFSRIPLILRGRFSERQVRRKGSAILESLARLPLGPRSDRALDELRSRWHEILPMLLAVTERLPGTGASTILNAVREGIQACNGSGGEIQEAVFRACVASQAERVLLAGRSAESSDPVLPRALVYLLAAREPGRALEIVRRLPVEDRDLLCLRLVRFRWFEPEAARPIPDCISDPALREEAFLWLTFPEASEEDWLRSLATLTSLRSFDTSGTGSQSILERLWSCGPDQSRFLLAGAFPHALRAGGRSRGESTLRLWLHAHLSPAIGTERPEALQWEALAGKALESSLVLSP